MSTGARGVARVLCLACSLGFATAEPAQAAEWSTIMDGRLSYTDDVFQFSAARRQKFSEDPSQPTVVQAEKQSDFVWDPALEVKRTSESAIGPTEVSVKAHGYLFTNNPIFNHGDYRLQLKQAIGTETSVLVRYRYVPNLFLGPNIEHRTGNQLIEEERVTSHMWRTEVSRQVADSWRLTLIGRYGMRFYNAAFAERDTKLWTLGPQLEYRVTAETTIIAGYLYERGLADGRTEAQFQDDISYRQHVVSFGVDQRLSERFSLHLLYLFRKKYFTSEISGDTHVGRHDYTHQGQAELRYRFTTSIDLTCGLQRTQRTSSNELKDFNDTILSIGAQYRF